MFVGWKLSSCVLIPRKLNFLMRNAEARKHLIYEILFRQAPK